MSGLLSGKRVGEWWGCRCEGGGHMGTCPLLIRALLLCSITLTQTAASVSPTLSSFLPFSLLLSLTSLLSSPSLLSTSFVPICIISGSLLN